MGYRLSGIPFYSFLAKDEVREIYANRTIRTLAFGLIGIFVPIYLLKSGYQLLDVGLFLVGIYSMMAIFSFPAAALESKFGLKHTILISTPLLILYFGMLFTINQIRWPAILLGMIQGIESALYWLPMNTKFSRDTAKGTKGRQISKIAIFEGAAAITAPLIGGIILSFYSFSLLIIAVVLLIIISIVPLFLTRDKAVSILKGWGKVFSKNNLAYINQFFLEGAVSIAIIAWIIYVYLVVKEYLLVGAIYAAVGAVSAIFTVLVGRWSDTKPKATLMKIGAVTSAGVWLLAFFSISPLTVTLVSLLQGFSLVMIFLPSFTSACNAASKQNPVEFMVLHESGLGAGKILALIPLILIPSVLGLKYMFIVAAIASGLFLFSRLPK